MDPAGPSTYPGPTSTTASAVMRGNRRSDTKPELRIRSALHRLGWRFRKDYPVPVLGTKVRADIVFTRARVAVFVDGCFWHACPRHGVTPKGVNAEYWRHKLDGNVERDKRQSEALSEAGWHVVRIWEHEQTEDAVKAVENALEAHTLPER